MRFYGIAVAVGDVDIDWFAKNSRGIPASTQGSTGTRLFGGRSN